MNKIIQEIFDAIDVEDDKDLIWGNMLQLRSILEINYRGYIADHQLILTHKQMDVDLSLEEVDEIVAAIFSKITSTKDEWMIGSWIRVLQKARPRTLLHRLQEFFLDRISMMNDGLAYHTILCLRNCYVYSDDKDFDYIKSALKFDELTIGFQILSHSSAKEVSEEANKSIDELKWFITQLKDISQE